MKEINKKQIWEIVLLALACPLVLPAVLKKDNKNIVKEEEEK